jgi:nucleoside 2-deoxyribosyltransferase
MKVIYISGPFTNPDPIHGIERNINAASEYAAKCWAAGWSVICPHKNNKDFQHLSLPYELWIEGDIELLRRCDAILMLPNWEESAGAVNEHNYAIKQKNALGEPIKVFYAADGIPIPV